MCRSDSGHQASFGPGSAMSPALDEWTLNEEAIANLGYMQMKKTRDAAMVIMERVHGARARFNDFIGMDRKPRRKPESIRDSGPVTSRRRPSRAGQSPRTGM